MTIRPRPPADARPSRRPVRWGVTATVWALVLGGLLYFFAPDSSEDAPPRKAATAVADSRGTTQRTPPVTAPPTGPSLPRSTPVRLRIPDIAVNAPFTDLSIGPSGALDAPPADDTNLVGWHAAGVSPGQRGTALIAGHLDTATAPAVFARLGELTRGDRFEVDRTDGTTAVFLVDSVESFRKDDFPDERVYSDTRDALVRLITCGGAYDRKAKDYTENLVVFAHLDRTA
ncbi:class F sortase [Streptomyces sp. HUAS MG47]|uniref:class F sortase n=1 Tax=Streptomyces solicamelliae TaxID=3231716 RepID=UPI00387794B0